MNAASPYTSEGTKALAAFMGARGQDAETAYRNEVARHQQALQAAQGGYRMALQQAAPMIAQADRMDSDQAAANRQSQNQSWMQRQEASRQDFEDRQNALSRSHQEMLANLNEGRRDEQASNRQMEDQMARMLVLNPHGRALLAAHIASSLGWPAGKTADFVKTVTLETPDEALKRAQAQLEAERARSNP
jgi:hypothetical protein